MPSEIPPRWATPFLLPFVPAYAAAVAWRNRRFDREVGVARIDPIVVSVGNIVMGGTGKTPVCRWLAETASDNGFRPAIAMRGYRASANGLSDEAAEYAMEIPDVPIALGADRYASIQQLQSTPDCVILDDGFQHRRLHRDLDLVLIDASRTGLDRPMIPAGPRRETLGSLGRADAVIVTRATKVDPRLARVIQRHHGRAPIAWTRHRWRGMTEYRGEERRFQEVDSLKGRSIFAVFGTGNPESIRHSVVEAGADLRGVRFFRDHATYTPATLSELAAEARRAGAEAIFTTAKDWVKWASDADRLDGMPVLVPKLRIDFLQGESDLRALVLEVLRRGG